MSASREKRLRMARKIRHRRGTCFRALEEGKITLISVLEGTLPDPIMDALGGVDLWDILRRAPKLGRDGARKVCMESKVWPHSRLGNLTSDERERVLKALPDRAKRFPVNG